MKKIQATRRNIYVSVIGSTILLIAQFMGLYNILFKIVHTNYLKSGVILFLGGIIVFNTRKYFEESALDYKCFQLIGLSSCLSGMGSIIFYFINIIAITVIFFVVSIICIFMALLTSIRGLMAYGK